MPSIEIDGQKVEFSEGQTILEAARSAGVYIPAICYLSGCSPTVACKMCMVEVEGKRVYACNTKPKANTKVATKTAALVAERQMIMQTYDVNHPLECGVCDKSGECELQDMTHRTLVDRQPFSVRDNLKPFAFWAQASYDPNLCIMCERCVTTCSDNIGDSNLKASKASLHAPDKFKESMPKDPFSVWSRKQKGMIAFVGDTPCYDCGECIAVCPVGAIVYKDFSYKANAWELKHIDSTCMHCAAGCLLDYQVRHFDTLGEEQKIFRVGNDFYHNPICGAGRFAFDLKASTKGSSNIEQAVQKLKEAKAVYVGGDLSNEEAYLLEQMRQTCGFKLHNSKLYAYQEFLKTFSPTPHDLKDLKSSSCVLSLGSRLKNENPLLKYALANVLKVNKGTSLIYAHPLEDMAIEKMSRSVVPVCHAVGAEEIILGAFLMALGVESPSLESLKASALVEPEPEPAESAEGAENAEGEATAEPKKAEQKPPVYAMLENAKCDSPTFEKIKGLVEKAPSIALLIGPEIYTHPKAHNIALMLQEASKLDKLKIFLIPPSANALGIVSLCTLEKDSHASPSVGVRTKGDFVLDSDCVDQNGQVQNQVDFILPSFSQMEASMVNLEGRVLALRPALAYEGLDFADIAQHFGFYGETLAEYTQELPQDKGFLGVAYDDLTNFYANDKSNHRGYKLQSTPSQATESSQPITPIESAPELNAYLQFAETQFNTHTIKSQNLQLKEGIYTSKAHLESLGLVEGTTIRLSKEGRTLTGKIYIDHSLKRGVFMASPSLDTGGVFASPFETLEWERA
ncbi:NADH-ubiquinone oxidoreductase, NQO3 subunit [Helicobacter sp. NHP19-003]|uniref:NADH-ubiquinone oxidoreductase, NQO3 subunit n=1 Tax=Helicobacter gastrocanis TaxID=2849641 RepID=A0ABN6I4A4_9HELI|nr:NADH-quinone oxidoreductase subunit G [Helicobacter sp. NHP19-003]BCZ17008.1 NADH-ubiquinone oxidoreductase, NQO3 subunit [Helicobacter sp. NHP19-003]